ncbi:recombinase RecT [Brachybacterium sp.]|uniref:recombinase RecT n=1 Tax=Brachybacterium sp. TaxID=1891286 RepID=UPI002ED15CC4
MTTDLAGTIATNQSAEKRTAHDLIRSMIPEFGKVLPEAVPVDTFLRLALTELQRNTDLQACTPGSLLGSLMLAAQLGLEPGGPLGHLYLTPRRLKGEMNVVPIIGYKGLVELSRRSGKVGTVKAQIIRDGDLFDQGFDTQRGGEYTTWRPADHDEKRPPIGVLAWATLIDTGSVQTRFTPIDAVDARRDRGAAGAKGPWATDRDAMIRKTGIRALAPDLPASTAMALATRADERITEYRADVGGLIDAATGEVIHQEGTDQ